MNEKDKALILDFSMENIVRDEFESKFNHDISAAGLLRLLAKAQANKDADDLSHLMLLLFCLDFFDESIGPILCELLVENWHECHEDISMIFQNHLHYPGSVEALVAAMKLNLDYLEYNHGESLIIKCTHALGDLGTESAIAALKELKGDGNKVISKAAAYQLERIRGKL